MEGPDREGRGLHGSAPAVIRPPRTRPRMVPRVQELVVILLGSLLCLTVPAHGQAPRLSGGDGNFLEWMGLEAGVILAYDMGGIYSCPRVGDPVTIDGRRYAPIGKFDWQGPERVRVPLDGSISLAPPPAETAVSVYDSLFYSNWLMWSHTLDFALNAFTDRDGWVAVGHPDSLPRYLLYRWCTHCDDAGSTVLLEKGKGIVWMTWDSYLGRSRIKQVERSLCCEDATECGSRSSRDRQ